MNTASQTLASATRRLLPVAAFAASLPLVPAAFAADGSLVNTYTGGAMTWTDTTKWTDGVVADGIGAVATLSSNYTSGGTISGVTGTLGGIVFADTTPSNHLITLQGSLTFAKSAGTPTISVSNTGNTALNLDLTISGTQGLTITNGSATTTTRFGSNSNWSGFTGVLTLDTGTFAPQTANKLPSAAGSSVNLINNAVLNPGATSGRAQTIVGLAGTAGTSLKIAGSSGYTFGTNSTAGQSFNFLGNISGVAAADTGTITKNGASTQKLGGTNTYVGTTTVNGGTLLINGTHIAAADGGGYIVNSGGTLGGVGTIKPTFATGGGAAIDVRSGGIVAPGDGGVGVLTLDQSASAKSVITMNTGATYSFDLGAGVTADKIAFVGSATVTEAFFNGTVINFTDLTSGALATGDYLLFDGDANTNYGNLVLGSAFVGASVSGTAITGGLVLGTGLESYSGSQLFQVGNDIYLNVTAAAVPEPSAFAALAGLGALGCVAARRRRRG